MKQLGDLVGACAVNRDDSLFGMGCSYSEFMGLGDRGSWVSTLQLGVLNVYNSITFCG